MNNTLKLKLTGAPRKFAMLLFFTMLASMHAYSASYSEGWEDRSFRKSSLHPNGGCYFKPSQSYNSFEISTNYKREGSYSLRTELNGAHKNSICPLEYNRLEKRSRSELRLAYNHSAFKEIKHGQEIWWGSSYYFPSNEGTFSSWWNDSQRVMIAQFMGAGNSFSPEIFMTIGAGKLSIESYYSTVATGENLVRSSASAAMKSNQWNDIVVNWKRTWQSSGFLRVWVNGILVVNKSGPVAIRDKPHGYISQGAYFGTDIRNEKYVWYIDGTKIGDENSSYEAVSPGSKGEALPLPPHNVYIK
jgi:hypothetical protein